MKTAILKFPVLFLIFLGTLFFLSCSTEPTDGTFEQDPVKAIEASSPKLDVTISTDVCGPPASQNGTFTISIGDYTSSGTVVTQTEVFGPDPENPKLIKGTNTFQDESGSFVISFVDRPVQNETPIFPVLSIVQGTFKVVEGSGVYENLKAHGTVRASLLFSNGEGCGSPEEPSLRLFADLIGKGKF